LLHCGAKAQKRTDNNREGPIQTRIRCMMFRGGTSKGAYFLADELPADPAARDAAILSIMGSPDARQIDGIGGAHPLTSKIAIVSRAQDPGCDVEFRFGQVQLEAARIDYTPNCGNILAGVAPFALERGLLELQNGETRVRIRTLNTGTIAELAVQTPDKRVAYDGTARIDGVPGTAAPIRVAFLDAEGSVCGKLLPTGNAVDRVAGIDATLIDNGMPVVVLEASSVGRTGYETQEALDKDAALKARLEEIRLEAGRLMGLGDVRAKVIPKMALVAPPVADGTLCTRSFIPHACHASIGVFAAVSVATAAALPGTPAARVARMPAGRTRLLSIEHPTGALEVALEVGGTAALPVVERAGLLRTARLLFDGYAFAQTSEG
jgi:4-oxalomesaconate tautomerase